MTYNIVKKSLFDSDAQVLVHQVNCTGRMGSGVAKQVRDRFPDVYLAYHKSVVTLKGECLGGCLVCETSDGSGKRIANLFGQFYYRGYKDDDLYTLDPPYKQPELTENCEAIRFTNYEAFWRGLQRLKHELRENETKIAFPYLIGCDRGGAKWSIIEAMIKETFIDTNIEIEICKI